MIPSPQIPTLLQSQHYSTTDPAGARRLHKFKACITAIIKKIFKLSSAFINFIKHCVDCAKGVSYTDCIDNFYKKISYVKDNKSLHIPLECRFTAHESISCFSISEETAATEAVIERGGEKSTNFPEVTSMLRTLFDRALFHSPGIHHVSAIDSSCTAPCLFFMVLSPSSERRTLMDDLFTAKEIDVFLKENRIDNICIPHITLIVPYSRGEESPMDMLLEKISKESTLQCSQDFRDHYCNNSLSYSGVAQNFIRISNKFFFKGLAFSAGKKQADYISVLIKGFRKNNGSIHANIPGFQYCEQNIFMFTKTKDKTCEESMHIVDVRSVAYADSLPAVTKDAELQKVVKFINAFLFFYNNSCAMVDVFQSIGINLTNTQESFLKFCSNVSKSLDRSKE